MIITCTEFLKNSNNYDTEVINGLKEYCQEQFNNKDIQYYSLWNNEKMTMMFLELHKKTLKKLKEVNEENKWLKKIIK